MTFAGEAVPAIVGAFEDFDVTVDGGNTTGARAETRLTKRPFTVPWTR